MRAVDHAGSSLDPRRMASENRGLAAGDGSDLRPAGRDPMECDVGKRVRQPDRRVLRRWLVRTVAAVVIIPMALVVLVGLGALLNALGDRGGAMACARLVLFGGVVWATSLVAMGLVTALTVAEDGLRRPSGGRRRLDRPPGGGGTP